MMDNDFSGNFRKNLDELIVGAVPQVSHGMSVLVAKGEKVLYKHSVGEIKELGFVYTNETVYDLASLTKPTATAALALKFLETGKIALEDTLETYGVFSGFASIEKLTVKSLLTHTSGFIPHIPLYETGKTRDKYLTAMEQVCKPEKIYSEENYSDLNFILLGFLLERLSGKTLRELFEEYISAPLNLRTTGFQPDFDRKDIAPAEVTDDRGFLWGKVHDENSYYLGGVAGHAGLFSNLNDLHNFYLSYVSGRIISKTTLKMATTPANEYIGGMFGLGWMINLPRPNAVSPDFGYARFAGDYAPFGVYGHTGFTGPSVCIDPVSKIMVIILANRVYPTRDNLKILRFRRIIHNRIFHDLLNEKL